MGRSTLPRAAALLHGWRRSRAALGGAAALALVIALAPGELAPPSVRAAAAACAIGAAGFLARTRLAQPATAHRLAVLSRQALSREAGLALVEVDGRALLIGYGGGPVQLLHEHATGCSADPCSPHPRETEP
jgi:flagellar protein FliO/FliZ